MESNEKTMTNRIRAIARQECEEDSDDKNGQDDRFVNDVIPDNNIICKNTGRRKGAEARRKLAEAKNNKDRPCCG